jgi:hypothetical protein
VFEGRFVQGQFLDQALDRGSIARSPCAADQLGDHYRRQHDRPLAQGLYQGRHRPPAKERDPADVSGTTALTQRVEIDGEIDLATQGHRFLVGARTAHEAEALDQGLRDALSRHFHRFFEELRGQVRRDPSPSRHVLTMLTAVMTDVNISMALQRSQPRVTIAATGPAPSALVPESWHSPRHQGVRPT